MMPKLPRAARHLQSLFGGDALLHLLERPVRARFGAEENHGAARPSIAASVASEYRDMISTRASHHQRSFNGARRSASSRAWSSRKKKFMS